MVHQTTDLHATADHAVTETKHKPTTPTWGRIAEPLVLVVLWALYSAAAAYFR